MPKKIFFTLAFLAPLVIVIMGCSSENSQENIPAQDDSDIIFFYGRECPHCREVEKYLSQNNVSEKIQFSQREIYHDRSNASLALEKAKNCGIEENKLGVPFLWTEGQCYFGDTDIIQFFNQKINASQ